MITFVFTASISVVGDSVSVMIKVVSFSSCPFAIVNSAIIRGSRIAVRSPVSVVVVLGMTAW